MWILGLKGLKTLSIAPAPGIKPMPSALQSSALLTELILLWSSSTSIIYLAYIWSVYDSTLYPLSAWILSKIFYPLEISFLLFMQLTLKLHAMG